MKPRKATTGIVPPSRMPLSRLSSSRTLQTKATQEKTTPARTPAAAPPPDRTPQTKTPQSRTSQHKTAQTKTPPSKVLPSKIPVIRTPPATETPNRPSTRQGRSQDPQQTLRVPSPNPQTKSRIAFGSEPPPIHRRPSPSPSPVRPPQQNPKTPPKTTVSSSQKPRQRTARISSVPPHSSRPDQELTPKEQQVANDRRRSAGRRTGVSLIQRLAGVKKTKRSS